RAEDAADLVADCDTAALDDCDRANAQCRVEPFECRGEQRTGMRMNCGGGQSVSDDKCDVDRTCRASDQAFARLDVEPAPEIGPAQIGGSILRRGAQQDRFEAAIAYLPGNRFGI